MIHADTRGHSKTLSASTLTLVFLLPPPLPPWYLLVMDAVDGRGATELAFVPTPTAGDIDLTGTLGGGPGSAPGERRCIDRGNAEACIIIVGRKLV